MNLKRGIVLLVFIGMFSACGVESNLDGIQEKIDQYITVNNINADKTTLGVYYTVETPGAGDLPLSSDLIVAHLRGSLIDGRVWLNTEGGQTFRSLLNNTGVISGLRDGLLQFKTGSSGKMIIPPNLGFGNTEFNGIPANSVLIMDVKDIQVYPDEAAYSDDILSTYIADKNLSATKTASGLYYTVDLPGNDTMPTAMSTIVVKYKGYWADGSVFDEPDQAVSFGLSQVIEGWTEGMQFYGEGGKGTLLIPSNLAYSAAGNQSVPPHTPLLFDIEIIDVVQ